MQVDIIEDIYPLTPMQQGMLFHTLYAPESEAYFEQLACRLRGALDAAAFRRAWQRLVDRHPVLRTAFEWEEAEQPVQVVFRQLELPLEELDWRHLSAAEQEERLAAFLESDRRRGFVPAEAPLQRLTLIRLAEEEHAFVWSHHHLLLDGWCLSLLFKEVFAFYEAFRQGRDVALGTPRPFRDYVAWLLQRDPRRAEAYWRRELQGLAAPTAIPVVAPAAETAAGDRPGESLEIRLDEETTGRLEALARLAQVTPSTVVQAAWGLLLGRYSGEPEVLFGVTVSGRPPELRGAETMVGLFINTLPLRVALPGEETLTGWLQRLQSRQAEMRDFEHTPLIEIKGWSEMPPGAPLFESLLAFENYPVDQALREQGTALGVGDVSMVEKTNYPLTLIVAPGREMRLRLSFDAARVERAAAARMLGHCAHLLAAFAARPESRLAEIPLLAEGERWQLLGEWNDTGDAPAGGACLHELFAAQAARTPEAEALVAGGERLTYAELADRAGSLARQLRRLGVGPEVRVGVFLERSPALVAGLLGILEAGGAYVPLDPAYPEERLRFMIEDADAAVVLTAGELAGRLPAMEPAGRRVRILRLDEAEDAAGSGAEPPALAAGPRNLAYLIYTSGSTGRPKAVAIEHRSAAELVRWACRTFPEADTAAVLAATSISFDLSVFELFVPLARGGKVVLAANALALPGLPAAAEVTLINTVPSAMAELVRAGGLPPAVRAVCLAGEPLPGSLAGQIYAAGSVGAVYNLYGPSEDTTYSTFARVPRGAGREPSIGRPVDATRAYVVDREGGPAPLGVPGELWLGGAGLARGYLGRPDLTAERFVPDPFGAAPGERLYRTGDLVRRRADADLEFLGRIDHQVKVRGFRVELGEIEAALSLLAGVREAVVAVREAMPGDRRLVAWVTADGPAPAAAELRAALAVRLPEHMVPSAFVALGEMPRTPNGKVDRKALPDPQWGGARQPGAAEAPRTPTEEILAGLWADVLGLDEVGVHDDFFALGGHSLLAMQVASRLRWTFQVDLPLRRLFEAPTVARLAAEVERAIRSGAVPEPDRIEVLPRDGELPLSFAQQRLWFLDQLEPGSPLYNLALPVRLTGRLEAAALEVALAEVARRHESLRTTFGDIEGRPFQRIAPPRPLPLPVVDLAGLPAADGEAARLARAEARQPFDLAAGPLWRASLVRLAAEEHLLLLTMHHVVSDGWSIGVLVRELLELYAAATAGRPPLLPEPVVQYADFAAWQRRWLEAGELERQLAYWRRRLAHPPVLELPLDRPRPPVQSFRGGLHLERLGAPLPELCQGLSRREGATLFMTLLAAAQALLGRLTGQEDLLIGTPVAGRNRPETEGVIGLFVNTLVLRADLSGDPSFRDLLARVRESALGAFAHPDVPFERLVDELQPERDLSRSPLFQVMFGLQNVPLPELAAEGLRLEPVEAASGTQKFDLGLNVEPVGESLVFRLGSSRDLFDGATARRMLGQLSRLLAAALDDPEVPFSELPLLAEAESAQVLREWNDSRTDYPRDLCVHELFERQADRAPGRIAVACGGETMTYGELERRANRLAHRLRRLGVGPDVPVALYLERSLDLAVALVGVLKAGGAYVPLDLDYPAERVAYMLEESRAAVLVTVERLLAGVPPHAARTLCLDAGIDESEERPAGGARPDNLFYVMFTSGSTGRPKGVMEHHRGLINRLVWAERDYPLTCEDRVLQQAPLSFDPSVWEIFGPLLAGARIVFARPGEHREVDALVETMRGEGVTIAHFLPSILAPLLDEGRLDSCRGLRYVLAGGEALTPELVRLFRDRMEAAGIPAVLHNQYGPTEVAINATVWISRPGEPVPRSIPIGRVLANKEAYVLDRRLRPVPIGVAGELFLGGDGVARGYFHRPGLTAERFLPDPFSAVPGARLYRTGDVARWLPSGELAYLGRIDHQVKVRGVRIELGEVEAALASHPQVREAVVVAREMAGGGKRLVGYVVPAEGAGLTAAELREHLQQRLPDPMVPTAWVLLAELPLTPNGKVDRRALPEPAAERLPEGERTAPRDAVEEALAAIWCEVLRLDEVGVDDNFFELGGDSILSIQVVSRARRAGLHLSARQVFENQTVAELARVVAAPPADTAADEALGPVPLTPIQARFFEAGLVSPHHWNQALLLAVPRLDPAALQRALTVLLTHHDALRTRFTLREDGWSQEIPPAGGEAPFAVIDLAALPEGLRAGALEGAAAKLQASLDLSRGPLVRFASFVLGGDTGRLLLIAHHLVVDGVSWRVLLDDLERLYGALAAGRPADPGAPTTSFRRWAQLLEEHARRPELRAEAEHWLALERSAGGGLPVDHDLGPNTVASARVVAVELDEEETRQLLQEVPRAFRARVDDALLAALGEALAAWTGAPVALVDLEGHGREEIVGGVDLSRTVGWLTTVFPVLLEPAGSPGASLRRVKERLHGAPSRGLGYGLLLHLGGDAEMAARLRALPRAQVAFNYLGRLDRAVGAGSLFRPAPEPAGPSRDPRGARHHLLEIDGAVSGDRLRLSWTYSANAHRRETVEAVAGAFLAALRRILAGTAEAGSAAFTAADFPLAGLDGESLARVLGNRTGVEDLYPLSPMQQGILFHCLFDPASAVYRSRMECTLRGALDEGAFERAWREVVDRHPVLRTAFLWEGLETPLQVVQSQAPLPLRKEDWRGLPEDEARRRLAALAEEERGAGFDLGQAPLMRLRLVRLGDEEWRLAWDHHHLLIDGWSLSIVLRELFTLYEAFRQGAPAPLERPRPFRDYVAWLQTRDVAEAEAFWRRQLAGLAAPPPLGLPRPADVEEGDRFGEVELRLPAEAGAALQSLARQCQVTLGTVLQSAWALLLSRYEGGGEAVFGAVVAGRPPEVEGFESIVGLFINTLPLRVAVAEEDELGGWLRRLQEQQAALRQYEWAPLAQIQRWSGASQGEPLFHSLFAFESYPVDVELAERGASLRVEDLRFAEQTSYPLALSVYPGAELRLQLVHDARQVEGGMAARLLGHLRTLLLGYPGGAREPLAALPLLSADEAAQVLGEWSAAGPLPAPLPATVHALFEAAARRHPEAPAVISGDEVLSYGDLDARADRLARRLRAAGVGPETLVGLRLERSPELAVALLAVLKAGGACLPLDPAFPAERLDLLVSDAGLRWVLDGVDGAGLPEGRDLDVPLLPDHLAYVIYTSGSTGRPKGVLTTHGALVAYTVDMVARFGLGPADRILQFAPLSFDVLLEELLPTWAAGGAVVFADPDELAYGEGLQRVLEAHAVTGLELPASYWHEWVRGLAAAGGAPPASLRFVLVGCDRPAPERVAQWLGFGLPLIHVFGLTETAITTTLHRVDPGSGDPAACDVPIGRPVAGSRVYVLGAGLKPVPAGVAAELFIGGPGLARGYLGQPALTAERFIPNPFGGAGGRLYRTGDRARFRPDGSLEFLGRLDHQVKVRGFRIEPGEVEAALCRHPAVGAAVVQAWEERPGDRRLVAWVTPGEGGPVPEAQELRDHLAGLLPGHMVPSLFVPLDRLPLSPNGKVDRKALPAPDLTRADDAESFAEPRDETERTLARIWSEVLGAGRVGIHDNFFALGGDSILSLQVISRARQADLHLSPRQIFEQPTIAGLAPLAKAAAEAPRPVEEVVGEVPLTPIQRWFFDQDLADPHHFNMALLLETRERLQDGPLEAAVAALVRRHDALRLRFARRDDGSWTQTCLAPDGAAPYARIDLAALPPAGRREARSRALDDLQESLDLAAGPLLRAVLFDRGGDPGEPEEGDRLLLLAHHLGVDGVSWRVLVEDLETAYRQGALAAPATSFGVSFGAWARRLAREVEAGAFQDELGLWLADAEDAPPPSAAAEGNTVGSAATLRLALGAEETSALLREVPQAYRTRINDVLLAALGLAFSRWSGERRLLVDLEGHGREEVFPGVDLSRTVGWLTALFPVLLDAGDPTEGPGALLKRTKERLRRVPHGGLGFGALRYASGDPAVRARLAALPRPQVLFNYLGQVEQGRPSSPLFSLAAEAAGRGQSPRALRGHRFEINCRVEDGRLEVDWTWSRACHDGAAVERLAGGYLDALRELIAHCLSPQARGTTPSDFPLARLDQAWLDGLAATAPPIEDAYPLSPMQQGMLFHSLFDPSAGAYVAQFPCELRGELDLDAFRRAWEGLAARYEVLRSAFLQEGLAEPLQVVFAAAPLPWAELDWRDLPPAEQEERFAAWLREDRLRGFRTTEAPLTRLTLIRTAADAYRLVWSLHQMVADGWSLPLLFRDVLALYEALRVGRQPRLEPVRPYRDYIAWLQRQSLAESEAWWRDALAGFTTPTPLPGGRPAGPDAGRSYGERQVRLSAGLTAALQALAREGQVTLNSLLQGAWGLLLSRWSGADDVVFGVVVSGRPAELPGVESMVGLFINSLPLRLRTGGGEPALRWLQEMQERQSGLLQLQHTPLAQVQGWSGIERGHPLFESILVFQNYPLDRALAERSPGALDIRLTGSIEQTSYPLTLVAFPGPQLTLNLKYDRDRLDGATVERVLGHLERLLEGMAEDPQRRLADLPLLTEAERRQILEERSPAGASFPVEAPLHRLFERQAARDPRAIAAVCDGRGVTYGDLDARANRLARHLLNLGVVPGARVGLCLERDLELVIALLAVLKAGCAYVPLDGSLPAERLAFLLEDSGVQAVVTQESLLDALPESSAPRVCLEREAAALAAQSGDPLRLDVAPEQAAYVIYTSGSTGRPKGVVVSHANAVRLFTATDAWFGFGPQDVWTLFHSYAFDFSVWEIWGALLYGGRLVVVPYWVSRSPESFLDLLARERVTVLSQTPSAFRQLMRAEESAGTPVDLSLRWVVFGGEALELGSLRSWYERHAEDRPRLVNMYGITETTVHVTYRALSAADAHAGTGSRIGTAIPDLQVLVLDRHQNLVPEGVAGELCVGGAGLAWGYLGRPELTAERFVPHPFWNPTDRTDRTDPSDVHSGARLYRSGDLGRWVGGDLEYLGRIDHQVKVRGFRIELGEIEAALGRHAAVRETVVLARPGESGEARLVAYVVFAPERSATAGELHDFAGRSLPEHMVPSAFVALESLPLTGNGKVDRRALPAPEEEPRLATGDDYVAPRTREERVLAEVWARVLGVERVGVHDNFFALGGDSILSLRIMSQAREQGLEVALQDLFEHPTIAELTAALTPGEAAAAVASHLAFALVPERDRALLPSGLVDAYPVSRLQAGMLFHSSFQPESVVYHNVWSVRITAPFDEAALREAVRRLVVRHPVLRTSFDLAAYGEPLQLVHAAAEAPVAVDDLRDLPEGEQRARIESWLAAEQRRPFDWTRPPLVRFQVHRLSDEAFHFGLTEHHAILDGWSVASLTTELFLSFTRLRQGEDDGLAAPASTFREAVALEREALGSEEHRGFWERRLAGAAVAALPRWPAVEEEREAPSRIEVPVSPQVSDRLKRLAAEEAVPVKSVLLAAHLRVVQVLTGQSDLVTGLVSNGRAEGEDGGRVLGLFLNTLPLRLGLPGGTWRELVRGAFAAEREMLPFRRYPLAELQKARGGAALFETAFNFTHFHVFAALDEVGGVQAEESRELAETEIPLIADFNLEVGTQRIRLGLTPGVGQLPAAQVTAIAGLYAAALEALAADPEARYEVCSLLGEGERRQILEEWNRTAVDYPADRTVPELFAEWAARTPEAIAVACGQETLTYAELDHEANRLARHLRSLGVAPGALVGLYMDRCPAMVVGLLGILKAGAAYVALDPAYPPARLAFLLEDTGVPVVLSLSAMADALPPHGARVVCLDGEAEAIQSWSGTDPGVEVTPEHLAYVSYTSGSTGRPKGVEVRHRGVLRLLCGTDYADFSGGRTLLQLSPIAFDASTVEIWGALLHGGRCVLLPQRVPTVAELGRVVREAGVDVLPLTTSLYNAVIDEAPEVLAGVAQLLVGGEALSVHHVRKGLDLLPAVRFVACYGPTESTTFTCCYQVPRGLDPAARSILLGRPIGNTRVYLLDRHLEPVPPGTMGELWIGGAGLARGYLKRPELTAEKFLPDPFGGAPGDRLYRTGDLARFLPGGLIEFGGRVDDQVKIRGFRIEPGEIEATLLRHEEVKEAAVLVREDVPGSKRLVAYLVPEAGARLDATEVRGFLAARLPEHMVPAAFQILAALPLTPSGKVDRHALPAPERAAVERAGRVAPRSAAERALARIWEQLLGIEGIGVHDNFLELGGDSILSIQVVARASQAGLRLTPQQLFLHPTLAELAAVAGAAPEVSAEQGLVVGEVPLTPVQAWFLERVEAAPHHWNQSLLLRSRQPLEPRALARSVDRLLAHHDALRLRFTRGAEGWTQRVAGLGGPPAFACVDLAALPEGLRPAAVAAAAAAAQASLDLAAGPLLRALLFDLGPGAESRLLLAVHHLAVDGVSWRVLLEDLQTAYEQAARGAAIVLPAKTTSFREWAARLAGHARSEAVRGELAGWLGQPWAEVAPLPVDHPGGASTEGAARHVSTSLTPEETRALLQDVPAAYRTRINDVLLTALVRAFAAWTGNATLLIDLEGHGRDAFAEGLDVSRTVGWFTAIYPVLLQASGAGPGGDLKETKEALRRIPGQGLGYGLLRFLAGDPEVEERLRSLPRAEVLFNYLGQLDQVLPEDSPFQPAPEPAGPPCDPRERRGHLLEVNSLVADGRLQVDWTYGAGLHERSTIEALAQGFLAELRSLIAHCLAPHAGGCTPSDFPLAGLGQAELDRLVREPRRIEDVYPLSPTQQGILFHSLFAPDEGSYLAQVSCLLEGDLDVAALARAWQRLIDRHLVLRTAFAWDDPERLLQIVYRNVALPFVQEDWSDLSPERQAERFAEVLAEDRRQGFDLAHPPLMRLRLFRLGPAAHRLVWCAHHLLLDGWSLSIVFQELFAFYESFRRGAEPQAGERPPYRDYIAWLQGRDAAATERFWRQELRGFTDPLRLPEAAGLLAAGRGERRLLLPAARTAELELFARSHQITLNTLFQGVWGLLLSHLAGGEDVVFGATVAGRPPELRGMESMVGLFINTLPLRIMIDAQAEALDWLRTLQVRNVALREHEHTPLASIARWSDVPLGRPLFESILVFESYPVGEGAGQDGTGVALRDVRFHATTNYPLAVRVTPGPELLIEVLYDAGRIDAAVAERVPELIDALLGAVVREPRVALGELSAELERSEREARVRKGMELKGANARRLRELRRA